MGVNRISTGPDPTPIPQIHDPELVPEHRRLDCRRYNGCLTVAYKQDWPGFSCAGCQVRDPLTDDERRSDLEGMARLISEIPRGLREGLWEQL